MRKEVRVQEAWKRKYPEQVVCATCVDAEGRANIISLGWFMPTSFDPPMCVISVGHTRYSHSLIRESGEFVVAFPVDGQQDDVLYCGSHSGCDVDKFAKSGFTAAPAKLVRAPLLEGCLVNLECLVRGELDTGDHTVFAGEIVAAHVDDEAGPRIYSTGDGVTFKPFAPARDD